MKPIIKSFPAAMAAEFGVAADEFWLSDVRKYEKGVLLKR